MFRPSTDGTGDSLRLIPAPGADSATPARQFAGAGPLPSACRSCWSGVRPGDRVFPPTPSPIIANSWISDGRNRWREAAQAMYRGFQLAYPSALGDPIVLQVQPLSFFLADNSSNKDPDRNFTMPDAAHQKMDAWATEVIDKRQFAVFVTGQSLFTKAVGNIAGSIEDYDLPNYGDYGRLMTTLKRIVDGDGPVICQTGDVHWGGVVMARDIRTGRVAFTEIISSPVSLVITICADQIKKTEAFIDGLFGSKNEWLRHSDPDDPPAF